MADEELTESEDCCAIDASERNPICKECGGEGKPVGELTLLSLVKKPKLESIKTFEGFCFCETPSCGVIYFSNGQDIYLHKEDVNVRVGIKETEDPVPVCYCFGWTRKNILDQLEQNGFTTAVQEISAKVKADGCACEVNNPSGKCCLGGVSAFVKQLQSAARSV